VLELKNKIWMNGNLEWFAFLEGKEDEVFLGRREVPTPLAEGDSWTNELGDKFQVVDAEIHFWGILIRLKSAGRKRRIHASFNQKQVRPEGTLRYRLSCGKPAGTDPGHCPAAGDLPRYLEQIFQSLKRAGLLKSKRGPQGGYIIAKPLKDVTVKDVVKATEGDLLLVDCGPARRRKKKSTCSFDGSCVTQTVWTEASSRLEELFSATSLALLCERGEAMGLAPEPDLTAGRKTRRKKRDE